MAEYGQQAEKIVLVPSCCTVQKKSMKIQKAKIRKCGGSLASEYGYQNMAICE